jgi:hypothetical protein
MAMTASLILLVIQAIVFGSLVGSYSYEQPWSWRTYAVAAFVLLSIGWFSYRVLQAQPRNVHITILHFVDCPRYIS